VELLGVLGVEVVASPRRETLPVEVVDLALQLAGYAGTDPGEAVEALLAARAVARTERNWAAADAVRDSLGRMGVQIEDTSQGARVILGKD
jgi:cysteinyl-tRNA synthetase